MLLLCAREANEFSRPFAGENGATGGRLQGVRCEAVPLFFIAPIHARPSLSRQMHPA